jgi:hypothetical protein
MFNKETATREELIAQLEALTKAQPSGGYKVSAKGALSRYGLGRFPVTLYASQWRKVIADVKSGYLEQVLANNAATLKEKADAE